MKPKISLFGFSFALIFSFFAFLTALINYFSMSSPINHSAGVTLVMVTTLTICGLCILAFFFKSKSFAWERISIRIVLLVLLSGTLFAAYLLESFWLVLFVAASLIGIAIDIFRK